MTFEQNTHCLDDLSLFQTWTLEVRDFRTELGPDRLALIDVYLTDSGYEGKLLRTLDGSVISGTTVTSTYHLLLANFITNFGVTYRGFEIGYMVSGEHIS